MPVHVAYYSAYWSALLRNQLTSPSLDLSSTILEASFAGSKDNTESETSSLKRQKLQPDVTTDSIVSKIKSRTYGSIGEIEEDIQATCAAQIAQLKAKVRSSTGTVTRLPLEDVKILQRIMAFELSAREILAREAARETSVPNPGSGHPALVNGALDGVKQEPRSPGVSSARASRTVLSLFGNAPTPKQLFSSLQQSPVGGNGERLAAGAEIPLEELGLPNMLTASKLLPHDETNLANAQSKRTFSDVFGPPSSLPQLYPPKPNKQSSGRSGSISFVPGHVFPKPARKTYTTHTLPVGDWIAYGRTDGSKHSLSPTAKRKQRDRSLSTGESAKLLPEEVALELAVHEEAMFKAAFSSFAPTEDNSKALIPNETRQMMWWHRAGRQRFDEHFVADSDDYEVLGENAVDEMDQPDETRQWEEAIDNFDPELMAADLESAKAVDVSAEELIQEVSELLHTLSSYQRIRSSYVSQPARNPASPSPLLSGLIGTPTEPSKEETETYKSLRAQLAEMVERLPPYAVAKLDGEQLEDLRISKAILIQGQQYQGTLEDDQLTRVAKSAAAAAAAGAAARTTTGTSYGSTGGQYGRTPSVPQTAARSAHAPQSYYGGTRTPAAGFGRSTSTQNYNTPSTSMRQPYTQTNNYVNQANRPTPAGQTYGQANSSQFYQRPTYGQYGQPSPQPQSQMRSGQVAQGQAQYASRMQNSAAYSQNATSTGQNSYNQARPAHSPMPMTQNGQPGSGRVTPTNNPPRPQSSTSLGPSGFHTSMTSEQQQIMMERQRAQLAMQPQARMAAQPDVTRQGSGTPQPPQVNGVSAGGDQGR